MCVFVCVKKKINLFCQVQAFKKSKTEVAEHFPKHISLSVREVC